MFDNLPHDDLIRLALVQHPFTYARPMAEIRIELRGRYRTQNLSRQEWREEGTLPMRLVRD